MDITSKFHKNFDNIYFPKIDKYGRDIIKLLKSTKHGREQNLYTHLILSGEATHTYASKSQKGHKPSWKFYLTGFLHDIGKLGTTRDEYMNGHGIVGASMLDMWLFSYDFRKYFDLSNSDMQDIAAVINYHTCNCSIGVNDNNIDPVTYTYVVESLKACLSKEARHLLCALRVSQKPPHMIKEEESFFVRDVMTDFNSTVPFIGDRAVLLVIQGYSRSGKTNMAQSILQKFSEHTEAAFLIDSNDNDYQELREKIRDALVAKRICILAVDVMSAANMKLIFPKVAKEALRIFIWAHRDPQTFTEMECQQYYEESREKRVDLIRRQNKQDYTNPLGRHIPWAYMTSLTEKRIGFWDDYRPHFSLPISWQDNQSDYRLMWDSFQRLFNNVVWPRLYNPTPSLPPLIKDTIHFSLRRLISVLLYSCKGGLYGMISFFEYHKFNVDITYQDSVHTVLVMNCKPDNELLQPKWAREGKGRAYVICHDKGDVLAIKRSLERCLHLPKKRHIEFNKRDKTPYYSNIFLEETQRIFTLETLNDDDDDDGKKESLDNYFYISQKLRGSLLVVSAFPRGSLEFCIMEKVVNANKKNFWHVFTDNYLIIPATRNCINVPDYATKSFILTCFGEKEQVQKGNNNTDDIWDQSLKEKVGELVNHIIMLEQTGVSNLIFQMVEDKYVYLLGMFQGDKYVPHYHLKISKRILPPDQLPIKFPLYTKVQNTLEVSNILKGYAAGLNGNYSWQLFCQNMFNSSCPSSYYSIGNNTIGFVLVEHCRRNYSNNLEALRAASEQGIAYLRESQESNIIMYKF